MFLLLLVQVGSSFGQLPSLSFQVPSNNSVSFNLNEYCLGNNLTYWISGTYFDSSQNNISAPAPTICQRMIPAGYLRKLSPSASNAMIQDANQDQIYHSLEVPLTGTTWNVTTWNFTEFPSISQVATLEFDANPGGIYPFTSTSGESFLLLISYTEQNLTFCVITLQGTQLQIVPGLTTTMESWYDFLGADFQIKGNFLYVYVHGGTASSGFVQVYSIPTNLKEEIQFLTNITSESINVPELYPVRVAASGSTVFLCTSGGVIVLNLTGIENQQPYTKLADFPVNPGNKLLDCMAIDDIILVSTQQGVFNMTFLKFELTSSWHVLQSNNPIEEYDEGQVESTMFFQYSPVGQVIAYYTFSPQRGATRTVSFQVLNVAAADIRQAVVLDEPTINFLNQDCSAFVMCYPAFTLYNYLGSLYAVFDSFSALIISKIERNPTLTFHPKINGPYSYVGTLFTTELIFAFSLTALDINSPAIYQPEPLVSRTIEHYLGASDSIYTTIYFPVSNYFAGPNVTYSLSLRSTDFDNVILTCPSIVSTSQTLYYNSTSPTRILKVFDLGGPIYVAVLNNNLVQIYDCLVANLTTSFMSAVGPSQSGWTVTQFAFVTVLSTQFNGLLIESALNGVDYVLYDLYDLSDSGTPELIGNLTVQKSVSVKLQGYNGYIYSLTLGAVSSIYVLELLQPNSDPVPQLSLKDPISSSTISGLETFDPVDFTSSIHTSTIYIYDKNVGLAYIDLSGSTPKYELVAIGYVAGDGNQVSLALTVSQEMGTWLYVAGGNLLYAFTLNVITQDFRLSKVFPVYQNCVYSSPSVANTYLALTCNSTQVYVFDTTVPFSSSLLFALPISTPSSIALTALQSMGAYHLYHYTGLNLTRILIGQSGKGWQPSSALFQPTPGTTMWGRFTFYFSSPINQSDYFVVLNLTASSGMSNESCTTALYLEVWNPGTFIVGNPENSTSVLVKGGSLFYSEVTGQQLPSHYFEGLDITFSVVINDNQLAPVYPSDSCDNPDSFVCLTAKSTICQDCAEVPNVNCTTFIDDGSQRMYFATLDSIIAQVRAIDKLEQQPSYNVTEALNLTSSECYLLATIQRCMECSNIVIGACIGSTDGFFQSFLLMLNVSEPTYTFQPISFLVLTLEAAYIGAEIQVFASDGTQVFVYLFSYIGSPLGLFSMITAESLGLSWLAPTSFQALNETFFVMGDLNNGILLLRTDGITSFFIEKFIPLEYGDSSVAALRLFTEHEGSYLYVLSKGGYFSLFRLTPETFQFIMTVNPVNSDEEVLLTNVIDFNNNYQYVAYFVSVAGECCIRILDLEVDWRSAAYTTTSSIASSNDIVLGGNLQMLSTTEDTGTLLVAVLVPGSVSYTVFSIQLETNVYVYKSKKANANFTMQVTGSNVISKAMAPAFTIYFNSTDVDETDGIVTLHSDTAVYQTWWFWASIGFGLIITFTAVALLFIKYYHRTIPKPREKSILLQPVVSYSSRFTSMNLSLL